MLSRAGAAVIAAVLGVAAAPPVPARAAAQDVAVVDSRFKPDEVRIKVGGAVRWTTADGNEQAHNVSAENGLFRSGEVAVSFEFKRVFSAGSFFYFCEVHGAVAPKMDGFVRVPVDISAGPAGPRFTVKWATRSANSGNRFDVEYRVGHGRWKKWKADTRARSDVFGGGGFPVEVFAGTRYSLRARSQVRDGKPSRWSPVKSHAE